MIANQPCQNLVTLVPREKVLQLDQNGLERLNGLNDAARALYNAIIEQQDAFQSIEKTQEAQLLQLNASRADIVAKIEAEHLGTRDEIFRNMQAEHETTRKLFQQAQVRTIPSLPVILLSKAR